MGSDNRSTEAAGARVLRAKQCQYLEGFHHGANVICVRKLPRFVVTLLVTLKQMISFCARNFQVAGSGSTTIVLEPCVCELFALQLLHDFVVAIHDTKVGQLTQQVSKSREIEWRQTTILKIS